MMARAAVAGLLACSVVGATATVAVARTGSVSNPRSVVFYYGEASGKGTSDQFTKAGSSSVQMCASSDGGSNNSYAAAYYHHRFGPIPNELLKSANVTYNQGLYKSGSFTISSNKNYYTRSDWSAVPSLPNDVNGYVSTHNTTSSPCK